MNSHKRILFILPAFEQGGTISSLIGILNSELKDDFEFRVFSMKGWNEDIEELRPYDIGYNFFTRLIYSDFNKLSFIEKLLASIIKILIRIPFVKKRFVFAIVRVIEKREHPDVVVAFQESLATGFAVYFKNPNKVAWIHCDYTKAIPCETNEELIYSCFKRIVCVSDYTRRSFLTRYPSLSESTISIHNIFDRERILSLASSPIDDPRFDNSSFTIITVGRISVVKQVHQIPAMAKILKNSGLKFKWYIIGGGDEGGESERLRSEMDKIPEISKEVICLGNKLNPYPYFKKADVLVSNSSTEACPMIFNEAKLLELPIVSNSFGSSYEFIQEGKDGFIVDSDKIPLKILEVAESNFKVQPSVDNDVNNTSLNKIRKLFNSL